MKLNDDASAGESFISRAGSVAVPTVISECFPSILYSFVHISLITLEKSLPGVLPFVFGVNVDHHLPLWACGAFFSVAPQLRHPEHGGVYVMSAAHSHVGRELKEFTRKAMYSLSGPVYQYLSRRHSISLKAPHWKDPTAYTGRLYSSSCPVMTSIFITCLLAVFPRTMEMAASANCRASSTRFLFAASTPLEAFILPTGSIPMGHLSFPSLLRSTPVTTSDSVPSPPATTIALGKCCSSSMYLRACPSESVLTISTRNPAKCKIGSQYFWNASSADLLLAAGLRRTMTR
uniref:Uncharacterized protein n=1 Tax=Lutzomyia longipalpis TaxID=7200 RepID=A0A1B0CE39_LUTLO